MFKRLIGEVIHYLLKVYHKRRNIPQDTVETSNRHGLLFASGLITGEALIGILLAVPIVLAANPDVLSVMEKPLGAWPGIIMLVGVTYWLYRVGRSKA